MSKRVGIVLVMCIVAAGCGGKAVDPVKKAQREANILKCVNEFKAGLVSLAREYPELAGVENSEATPRGFSFVNDRVSPPLRISLSVHDGPLSEMKTVPPSWTELFEIRVAVGFSLEGDPTGGIFGSGIDDLYTNFEYMLWDKLEWTERKPGDLGTRENPVKCGAVWEYLGRLYGPEGEPTWEQEEGCGGWDTPELHLINFGVRKSMIFMDPHHPGYVETECIPGFILVKTKGERPDVIPSDKVAQMDILREVIESEDSKGSGEKAASQIKSLAARGLDVNARGRDGLAAMFVAIEHLEKPSRVMKALIEAGADVNARNSIGDTVLHEVINPMGSIVDVDAVKLLIDAGADLTLTDKNGDTAYSDLEYILNMEDRWAEEFSDPVNGSRLAAVKLLLKAGADTWGNYMGAPATVIPDPPKETHPVVADLAVPDKRDAAFRKILSWQKYRTRSSARERLFKPLWHVVVCPQREGPPMYATFQWPGWKKFEGPTGPLILIDADGAMIDLYCGDAHIDDHSAFKDVNGDGIIDEVGILPSGIGADVLAILPITREQRPILQIVLKSKKGDHDLEWTWDLVKTEAPDTFSLEFGYRDTKTGEMSPRMRYDWSKEKNDYVGPAGGGDLMFMRLNDPSPHGSEQYDKFVPTPEEKQK